MGLMDKVKAQAEQAIAKGKEGLDQGKTKVAEVQAKKGIDGLLAQLGAAYYAQQREGGSAEAVAEALAAVEAAKASAPAAPPSASPTDGTPAGNYSLDDV